MKSDFRTSSRGWLRPLLCWAPSTLLLLTITTLLLNAEYSSAVISEHTTVDNNWIKLDENFPPRHDAAGHPYSRFYYARGKITDRLRLRNETIAEITGKDITMFHVQFDIWRNNLKGKCAKQVTLSKGLTERPERLNTLSDGYWNHVSEQYTEEQFKKFELWLYAQEDCDNSLLAIKDLTVTYNSYIRLEDKKKQPGETFIQLTPDDLELSATGKEKHQYFLQDKLCHKQEGCTLKIKLASNANLKVYFWSTVEGDEIKAGTQSHKTPNQPETKFAFVELKNADMKKTTDNKYELTIQVVTAAENSLAIVQIGDEKLTTGFTIEPTGKVGDWEPVNPSLFNDFLNSHKGKAQLLAHKTDNATAKIGAEGTATVLADVCYKVTYFAETGAGQRKFTISADSVPVSNEDLVQSYPLVEFTPISGIKQPFEFCITDYIFDLKAVFKSGNVQLHLTTEANPSTDKANLSRKTAVVLEPTPKPKPADGGLHFIRETMKVDKVYESHLKWDSIVPGLLDDIKEDNNNPTNVITIKPDTSTNQTKQLFSKWLVNDIANINARPVVVELTLSGATTDELKNNNDFTVTATICDEIMECINTRKVETVNPLIQKKITYEFEFDAHPNAKSGHIKLRLAVGLPKGITAVVDLKSFGDPCFKGFKNVKSNDRCGINEKCDDKKNPKLSLANSGACTCNDNFIQNATGTCVEDQCNRPQTPENDCDKATLDCQNTPDGKSFECVCPASTTELQIWTTNKKCEKLLDPTQFKDNSVWIMPVGKVNPAIYDICYKFTPTVNPEPTPAKPLAFTFSLEYTYTDENGISKKVSLLSEEMFKLTAKAGPLVDLCLSQLMDGYVTKNAVLTATVKVQSQDKIEFAVDNSVLYSKEAPKQSLQNEHTKMISKSLSIPFGYLTPASTLIPPDNEKQTINIMHTDYHKNDKMTVYSEWITIPEIMRTDSSNNLNLNIIKPEVSGSVIAVNSIQLCRPRNIDSNAPYCAAYIEGNFVETLAMLEPTNSKFQIVYSLIVQDEIKAIDVPKTTFTSTVSLFNACQTQKPECKSNGKCAPREFTFQCEGGNCGNSAKGKLCDELECPPANKKICDVQHSDCVQFENRFQCRCPLGFESDETNQVCHRKGVQSNIKRCSPDSPGECPFTNITTNEHFSRLPSNFPRIDATNPGQRKEELYYAFRRASKLTVALQDKDKNEWVGQPNADVCIKFRYFVSKESTLTLHLIEPDNQAAPDLELVNLPSAFYDPEKNDATTTDATKTLSISPETEVCIKALLPLGKLQTLEKFNLVFVADVQSQDGAVIVELLPYNAGSLLIQVHKDREEVPNKALRYLSQATVELDEKKADGKAVQSDFRYQWPVLVPENTNLDNRWEVKTTPISPLVGSIAFKKGAIDGTKESVLIESAWIDRLLGRSTPAAAVNFYFKLDLPIAFKSTADFNMEIVLLNANRQPILANGNQPSIAPALNMDNILEKGMVENAQRKSKTFFLRLDQYEVPFGQKFKVQFRITFRNIKEFTGESFRISDLSFGDPCVEHKQKEGTDPEAAIKMRCQGVINDERKENKNAKCNRLPHPTAGTVDFQCECNDKALSGKKCELADNCKLKHKISAKNPDRQQDVPKVSTTTGEEYCKKINTKNECRNVEIGDKDFACLCENKKQKFNFFTQDCTDIDDCVFNPCDFATELCSINKDTKHRQCDCRPGYKRVNVNDTSCTPLSWEEAQCPIEECSSTDPNMRCLSGEKDVHRCTCRKGFVMKRLPGSTDRWHCESEMCSFQGLHSCEQGCESTQTPPYYQCKCGGDYEPVENHQTNVTECHLKATSACKNWSGRYKTCIGGVPGCVSGYELSADGTACQPKATFKLEPACPSGAYRFDEAAKEYVCDCSNATLTRGYFTADADMPATCKLTATVCDAGQPGRNVCSRLGAGCLLDPDSLTAYSCACHLGRLFPDGRRVLTSAELAKLPLPTGAVACLDVCELPYRRSQCAAIGAQCNSRKLWTALHGGQANIKAVDFCDCVSGTFAQTDDPLLPDTTTSCVQEGKALTLTLTIQWTADMQAELNKKMEAFLRGKVTTAQIMDKPTALQRHDPEGFARAEFRVIRANRAEASALTAAAWQEEIRATVLAHQAATLLADFKLANKPGDLKKPETIVGTDVQVVQVQEAKIDGRLLAYTVQLAVRMPDRVRKAEAELQQLYLDYLNVEEGEQPEADAAATTTAAAATTTAAATTPATHLDQSLPKSVDLFNEVMAACVALEAESCIISYLPIILRKAAKLEPALHQPCTTGGAGGLPACNGMSNCRPLNGSTFECLCGEGFDVEMSYTFKSAENKGLVVHKNEYCKAQDLCTSNCLDGDKTHTRCLHKAPSRDSATSHWVNSYSCDCVDKYVPQGANNGTCTYVCATLNCGGGDHGECVPAAKSASCRCKEGFYGEHCQHTVGSNTWWIVGIVVLGVLALAAIGAAVFFWRSSDSNHHTRSSSSPPNNSSQAQTSVTDVNSSRQAANIRRITAKADLTSVEQYEGTTAETSTENNNHHHQLPTEPEHSQHSYEIISHNQHQITTVESTQQQKSAPPESNLSSEPSGLEPGQLQLQNKTSPDQDSTTTTSTSSSSSSSSSAEENNSQNRFSSNTARSSFVSAGDLDSVLSRQTSINSLTVHEPFTPYNASPRSTAMYGGGARRSIVVPIIEENERELHKSRFSHSTNRSSSTSSSSSSESSSEEEKKVKIEEIPSGPPEPENAVFTTQINEEEEDTSNSSGSSSLELPTEPSSTSLAGPPEPSTKNLQPQQQQQPNQDLLRDSQEMDSAKFQHVRARIAAVLKLNSNRTYKVSQPSSPEVGRR